MRDQGDALKARGIKVRYPGRVPLQTHKKRSNLRTSGCDLLVVVGLFHMNVEFSGT